MRLLKNIPGMRFTERDLNPTVHCKVYEYNSGAMKISREYKYFPITKIFNLKLHHFRDYVDRGEMTIHKIKAEDKP